MTSRDEARRAAEEALAKTALLGPIAPASSTWVSVRADDLAALLAERPGHDRIGELEALLRKCSAVCLCGCQDAEHEADECGESCGHDDHECIRVPPAVLEIVDRLRARIADEPEAVVCDGHGETYDEVYRDRERLRESVEIERDGQRSMVRALAEIHRLSRLDVAISLASDAPSPARDEVREAAERLREQFAGHGPLTPFGQAAWDLLSALAAKGGDRG